MNNLVEKGIEDIKSADSSNGIETLSSAYKANFRSFYEINREYL